VKFPGPTRQTHHFDGALITSSLPKKQKCSGFISMSQRCKIAEMTLAEAALQRIIEIGFVVIEFVLGSTPSDQTSVVKG
jgi:hypothetical protein